MAGDYRASFDFLETVEFSAGRGSRAPYRSWGTERIYVVDDRGDAITLQHIIVMFTVDDGVVEGPFVQKHWRQDWRYEPESVSEYRGKQRWERRALVARGTRRGVGAGRLSGGRRAAIFERRPLGTYGGGVDLDRIVDLAAAAATRVHGAQRLRRAGRRQSRHGVAVGWVHEQDNLKLVLDEHAKPRADAPYIARELGIDRYERIKGFDFSAGDMYWRKTRGFLARTAQRLDANPPHQCVARHFGRMQ